MFGIFLLTAIILIFTSIYLYLRNRSKSAIANLQSRNIPIAEQPSFFSALWNKTRIELLSQKNIQKIGKVYGWEMFGGINVTIAEPELIQLIMSKEFINFPNRRKFNSDDPMFSNFLTVVDLDKWKRFRAIVAPTFATGKLRRMKPCMESICQTLIKNIDNELANSHDNILSIKRFTGAYTMDTILQVAFGCKIDSIIEPNHQLVITARKLFNADLSLKSILEMSFIYFFPPFFSKLFKIRLNGDEMNFFGKFTSELIERKRIEFAQKDFSKASTFIEFLLEAEHELENQQQKINNNEKTIKYMNNDEIIAQCVLFFLAGYETTATTITMALYYLALNPDKQQVCYEEVNRIISENEINENQDPLQSLSFENIGSKFGYVNAVIDETLRLIPPGSFTERSCVKDTVLTTEDGRYSITIQKGDIIQIPIYCLHYDEEYFPEPEKFIPERFIRDSGNKHPNYAYLPFGAGPRACVAKSLALMEAKLALIWLIKNFKFDKCAKTKIPVEFYNQGGLLSPRDIFLKVERRK
ncbi:cytochrome P450 3A31-like [Dermatophagoides pteronyssinus]|uniref:cytochrome P450 3A31-like n=1 Tax=Dermatophagoides pteronyssinus TaxID=6956 RepID=UPI003F665B26